MVESLVLPVMASQIPPKNPEIPSHALEMPDLIPSHAVLAVDWMPSHAPDSPVATVSTAEVTPDWIPSLSLIHI